jgi:tRNA G18 (ribose-2'-O)-methylase SpoU
MKYIILENVRSAYNVGAIFRTADGAGVDKIFLVGYTSTPLDRFGRPQPEITKTSLGASTEVLWEQVDDITQLVTRLQLEGCSVVAVEQDARSISIADFSAPAKVAYILGNEVTGVDKKTIQLCDTIIDLPMLGRKESLNVSVTAGIVMYHDLVTK